MVEAFWGSGPSQETSAQTFYFCQSSSSIHLRSYYLRVRECYRCSWRRSRGEAWPHHGHHGSSWCSGLDRNKREEKKEGNKRKYLALCVWPPMSRVHQLPVMSRLVWGHYWSTLHWWSYHAEAGVNPHKRRDTHGCGLQGKAGRERRRRWDVTRLHLWRTDETRWLQNHTQTKIKNITVCKRKLAKDKGDDTSIVESSRTTQDKQNATKALILTSRSVGRLNLFILSCTRLWEQGGGEISAGHP